MTAATASEPKVWTAEDLLAMPDDGVERWVIRGRLREKRPEFPGVTVTVRNKHHTRVMSYVVATLVIWLRSRPQPRGEVHSGEAGVRLRGDADGTVGVDVVYVPPEVVAVESDDETTLIDGVPTLAVEILSPNDTVEQVNEKVDEYLAAGVPLVWVVDPYRRDVVLHQPGRERQLFTLSQRLPEHPAMPGFAPAVRELFE